MRGRSGLYQVTAVLSLVLAAAFLSAGAACAGNDTMEVTDAWGRELTVPRHPERVICSGPGSLRYLVYLQAEDRIVGVDDMEKSRRTFEARPYFLAHPEFKEQPLFGEFRGHDNPELIAALDPRPQVIFRTYGNMGYDPEELQAKTGIPVVVLNYGTLTTYRDDMEEALRIMGRVLGREERAGAVIDFFAEAQADLEARTGDIPKKGRPTCYVGGIAHKGPHGFRSTEPAYPPFVFTNARNVAFDPSREGGQLQHATVAREQIVAWDPDYLFVDLSTVQAGQESGAVYQLQHDACYQVLTAVLEDRVYGVLPYNWYTRNYGSILANAYFVGSVLYPERFSDIDPVAKADEIYTFLVGGPVFDKMNESFLNLVFTRLDLDAIGN